LMRPLVVHSRFAPLMSLLTHPRVHTQNMDATRTTHTPHAAETHTYTHTGPHTADARTCARRRWHAGTRGPRGCRACTCG
jgi:hypothetical protein